MQTDRASATAGSVAASTAPQATASSLARRRSATTPRQTASSPARPLQCARAQLAAPVITVRVLAIYIRPQLSSVPDLQHRRAICHRISLLSTLLGHVCCHLLLSCCTPLSPDFRGSGKLSGGSYISSAHAFLFHRHDVPPVPLGSNGSSKWHNPIPLLPSAHPSSETMISVRPFPRMSNS